MKFRNKKTGQEGNFIINKDHFECVDLDYVPEYRNLAELNDEWEDYEEPKIKKYCWISPLDCGVVEDDLKWNESEYDDEIDKFNVEIGNYFSTKEEAEKAVEKLKAWKRLKDKGFKFICRNDYQIDYQITGKCVWTEETEQDLDLLFGGENE